jgi:O-antigen ligase
LYFSGFDQVVLFGIEEWNLNQNLEGKQRLLGAFNAAGVTAAFYASQLLFIVYAGFFTEKGMMRYLCYGLALVNFALIVASGSRGSFLSLLGSLVLLMYFLRPALGIVRVARITMTGIACFLALSVYVVTQTDFNVLFERLDDTELSETGVPDTRQIGFDLTLERVGEALMLGHGPAIRLIDEETRKVPGYQPLGFYPHNLSLFLIYTIGILGLIAYAVYFGQIFLMLFRAKGNRAEDTAVRYFPSLAIVFMIMLFVDQLKIEYLRFMFADYQHYIFYLLGMGLAFAKVAEENEGTEFAMNYYPDQSDEADSVDTLRRDSHPSIKLS